MPVRRAHRSRRTDVRRAQRFVASLVAASIGLAQFAAPPALAQATSVVASNGDPAPDGVGAFSSFDFAPSLNNAGQAAFLAILAGPGVTTANARGIFRGHGATGLTQVVRTGQIAPGGIATYLDLFPPALNNAGQVAFGSSLTGGGVTTANDAGIFRGNGAAPPTQIAREGQIAPGGVGTFSSVFSSTLNDAGQVAFIVNLTGPGTSPNFNDGLFRGDGSLPPVEIARAGQTAPGGGAYAAFGIPIVNDAGQVVYLGGISNTGGVTADEFGLFRADGDTAPTPVARVGQPAPGGVGTFINFIGPVLNDAGQTAFVATLSGPGVTTDNAIGIFRQAGAGGPVQIVRAGQAAPDGIAAFSNLSTPTLNNAGQAAFLSTLNGPGVTPANGSGVFRSDGLSDPVQIARAGQNVPGGAAAFADFDLPALNDAGQAAFSALLTGPGVTENNDAGLYFYDDALGLLSVAREGDPLLGSTIIGLSFSHGPADERSGLNDLGQVAYQFSLANGSSGIAIVTIPEPTSLAPLALAAVALLRRKGNTFGN